MCLLNGSKWTTLVPVRPPFMIRKIIRTLKSLAGSVRPKGAVKSKTASPSVAPSSPHAPRGHAASSRPIRKDEREGRGGHRPRPSGASVGAGRPPSRPALAQAEESWDPASYSIEPKEGHLRFADLGLHRCLLHALADMNFRYCTPIQAESMPKALAGQDVFGQAQTGTGKTAAFLLTIFQRLLQKHGSADRKNGTPRALILAPTRELAMQIEKDALALGRYTGLTSVAVYGGSGYEQQRRSLAGRVDVLVATPGRLLDFHSRHEISLKQVEVLVIDEGDRMLDMGFIPDVRRIVYSTPPKDRRQTMLYSATLSDAVRKLAASWTQEPVRIEVAPERITVDTVEQRVYIVRSTEKFPLLYNLLQREGWDRVLLFVNRRNTAERVAEMLEKVGMECRLISGALSQPQRTRSLESFREGKVRVLVATDVAGRGIHIDGVSHVVNYNIPLDPEDYVHRIGRTGRAGASGVSVTFACEEESFYIPPIEAYISRPLKCTQPEEVLLTMPEGIHVPVIEDRSERRTGDRRSGGRRPGGGPGGRRGPPRRDGGRR